MANRRPPSFFKILLDASAPHLPLPPDFVSRHLENKLPKDPVIRSEIGGYSWRLKLKKIGESYCFSGGWNNVVADIQLGFGDFLVFRFVDKSTFKLVVYSPNGCEKDFPPKIQVDNDSGIVDDDDVEEDEIEVEDEAVEEDEDEDEDDDEEEYEEERDDGDDDDDDEDDGDDDGGGDIDGDDGDPFFMSIISKTHKNVLRLPAEFTELAGIEGEGALIMRNLDGKEWETEVRLEKSHQSERYCISGGWADFQRSNGLSDGDECIFKFIRSEDRLLLAKLTKKRRPARQPQPSGDTPATEVVEKEKIEHPQRNSEIPATNVKTRGRAARERGGGGDEDVDALKRSRGRPPKRRCGKPAKQK